MLLFATAVPLLSCVGRVACPSRRNLRSDAAFDAIIKQVYPDIAKAEKQQEAYVQAVLKTHNVQNFAENALKAARKQQETARAARVAKRAASPTPAESTAVKRVKSNKPDTIIFSLVQHPTLASSPVAPYFHLPARYIRCARYSNMLHLKKYVQLKTSAPTYVRFLFYILVMHNVNGTEQPKWLPLGSDLTLDYIEEKLLDKRTEPECLLPNGSKRLQIYYHAVSFNDPTPTAANTSNTSSTDAAASYPTSLPTQPLQSSEVLSATEPSQYNSTAPASASQSDTSSTAPITTSAALAPTSVTAAAVDDTTPSISPDLLTDPALAQFATQLFPADTTAATQSLSQYSVQLSPEVPHSTADAAMSADLNSSAPMQVDATPAIDSVSGTAS